MTVASAGNRPSVSLIILTYNWPQALDLVLQSVKKQRVLPDEVIVADDGSEAPTRLLMQRYQAEFPVPLIHAWQADKGFRAARSRNNGVDHSYGDYLLIIDGDTVLHRDFVADHLRFATARHFTVGSRVLLTPAATEAFLAAGQCAFSLLRTPADNKINALHLPLLAAWYGKSLREPITKWIFKVRSCNMGVWRSDYEAVNGFNHDFCGWGREDSEFALRLFNKGLSMRRLKFAAIQYHLYHPENVRDRLGVNDDILAATLAAGAYRCQHGLAELNKFD